MNKKPPNDCTNMVLYGDGEKFLSPVWYSCGRCDPCPRDSDRRIDEIKLKKKKL